MSDFIDRWAAPSVSITDHRLACDARDRALEELNASERERARLTATIDSLTGQLASLRDKRTAVSLTRALKLLQDVMYRLRSYTGGPAENALHAEARAFLAEHGMRRVDAEMDEANKKWLVRR